MIFIQIKKGKGVSFWGWKRLKRGKRESKAQVQFSDSEKMWTAISSFGKIRILNFLHQSPAPLGPAFFQVVRFFSSLGLSNVCILLKITRGLLIKNLKPRIQTNFYWKFLKQVFTLNFLSLYSQINLANSYFAEKKICDQIFEY